MRVLIRSTLLLLVLGSFASYSQSQSEPGAQPAPDGAINLIWWGQGTPAPTNGGVDVTVNIKPAPNGWTCTELAIRVINAETAKTLAEHTVMNPGASVSKSFTGFPNNLKIRITADAVFQKMGLFDLKYLEEFVTTK
jgi:hypothetical protein